MSRRVERRAFDASGPEKENARSPMDVRNARSRTANGVYLILMTRGGIHERTAAHTQNIMRPPPCDPACPIMGRDIRSAISDAT